MGGRAWPGEEEKEAVPGARVAEPGHKVGGGGAGGMAAGPPQARPRPDQSPRSRHGGATEPGPQSERTGPDGALEHRIGPRSPREESEVQRSGARPPTPTGGAQLCTQDRAHPSRPRCTGHAAQATLQEAGQGTQEAGTLKREFKPRECSLCSEPQRRL